MIARGKYILSQFGPLAENCAFLVDGYVAGGTAVTVARRNFPKQFLHYHRAGHGAVTSPQTQRGYTAFVHTKISRTNIYSITYSRELYGVCAHEGLENEHRQTVRGQINFV